MNAKNHRLKHLTHLCSSVFISGSWLVFSLCFPATNLAGTQTPDEFPRSSRLRGREVPADLAPFSAEIRSALAGRVADPTASKSINPATISELMRTKGGVPGPDSVGVPTFRQVVSGVPIAGSLVVVKSYLLVPSDYVRNIEQLMRLNLSLPIFARTMSTTATVAYSFTVLQDGQITDLEKERSTGSPALDNAVQNLINSINPLDSPRGLTLNPTQKSQPLLRLRFTLTYHPSV